MPVFILQTGPISAILFYSMQINNHKIYALMCNLTIIVNFAKKFIASLEVHSYCTLMWKSIKNSLMN